MRSLRTAALLYLFALALTGCTPEGDARAAEIWTIDFETHRDEVLETVQELDLDMLQLEVMTIDYLYLYFSGLNIDFELGRTGQAGKSSICVRHTETVRIGRGILDIGNRFIDHDCGENAEGIERGVFINRLKFRFVPQVAGLGFTRTEQTNLFARLLGLILAHEIGHGLGLEHTDGIMDAFPDLSIGFIQTLTPTQRALIEENLAFIQAGA